MSAVTSITQAWWVLASTVLLRRGPVEGTHVVRALPYFWQVIALIAGVFLVATLSGAFEQHPQLVGLAFVVIGGIGFGLGVTWFYLLFGVSRQGVKRLRIRSPFRTGLQWPLKLSTVGTVTQATVEPGKLVFATPAVFVGLYFCMTVCGAGAVLATSATWKDALVVEAAVPEPTPPGRWTIPDEGNLRVFLVQVASMLYVDNLKLVLTSTNSGASFLLMLLAVVRNAVLVVMAPVVIQSLALVKTAAPAEPRR